MVVTIKPRDTNKRKWYRLNHAFYPYGGKLVRFAKKEKNGNRTIYFFEDDAGNLYAHTENEFLFECDDND